MAPQQLPLTRGRLEFRREHSNGYASRTVYAAWAVSDGLASAKTDPAKRLIQLARMAAG
jgi:hypothetical protein